MKLVLGVKVFVQTVLLIEQIVLLVKFAFNIKLHLLKLGLCFLMAPGIPTLFQKSFVSHPANIVNKDRFFVKELLFSGLVTPVLPGYELHVSSFISRLLTS